MNQKTLGTLLLSFMLLPVVVHSQTDALFVDATGNIGIGTSAPASILDIVGGLITLGDHTFGERVGAPVDLQFAGLRNIIYNVDSDNNSTNASFSVSRDGNPNAVVFVAREDGLNGFNRQFPSHPLHIGTSSSNGNGAHVTAAGVWTNGSSRTTKTNIRPLAEQDALEALSELEPVQYAALDAPLGEQYVGFIAEDVPDLVSTSDRKGVSAMDVVAVLTRVAQQQQRALDEQLRINRSLEERIRQLEGASGGASTAAGHQ
jgi:hypothetical protein